MGAWPPGQPIIDRVRRDSSTVVAVVGAVPEPLLADLARSPNVSVIRPDGGEGLDAAIRALREAASRMSPYVLVAADPLALLAAEWQAMWEPSGQPPGAARFEERAAEALAAWRAGRFELPDYYLVLAAPSPAASQETGLGGGLYLGPLRAVRPRRVAVVAAPAGRALAAEVLQVIGSLPHGPWWPPLDELVGTARRFFAGSVAGG
jgi:hypothetical protein